MVGTRLNEGASAGVTQAVFAIRQYLMAQIKHLLSVKNKRSCTKTSTTWFLSSVDPRLFYRDINRMTRSEGRLGKGRSGRVKEETEKTWSVSTVQVHVNDILEGNNYYIHWIICANKSNTNFKDKKTTCTSSNCITRKHLPVTMNQ